MSSVFDLVLTLEGKIQSLSDQLRLLKEYKSDAEKKLLEMQQKNDMLGEALEKEQIKVKQLQTANAILGSNDFSEKAKLQINALIKEIDACIVQLSK